QAVCDEPLHAPHVERLADDEEAPRTPRRRLGLLPRVRREEDDAYVVAVADQPAREDVAPFRREGRLGDDDGEAIADQRREVARLRRIAGDEDLALRTLERSLQQLGEEGLPLDDENGRRVHLRSLP